MRWIVSKKFNDNKDLLDKLVDTWPEELIEGNEWGDTFWGICNGVGKNHLGKILMEIRDSEKQKNMSLNI